MTNLSKRIPKFPEVIDSTMLAAFSNCPLKFYREYCLRLGNPHTSIHLHAGGAFAKAIEVIRRARWEKQLKEQECFLEGFVEFAKFWGDFEVPDFGSGQNKTFERMWQAVEFYFEEYPLDNDSIKPYVFDNGKTGIEFTFGIPLPIDHPDTNNPIVLAGRFDLLGYYKNFLAVVDEKTTSSLGSTWPNQWTMRGQMFTYVWAARQSGLAVRTAIIRGISILKTEFGTLEVYKSHYNDQLLDRWELDMIRKVHSMVRLYKQSILGNSGEKEWPMSFSSACTEYGGCHFTDLCTSNNPTVWYGDFGERNWNPLNINDN